MKTIIKTDDSKMMTIFKATNKENPKQKDIDALSKLLDENPHIWKNLGDIADRVKDLILKNDLSKDHIIIETTKKKMAEIRDNLGWENSTELEKLIIEQICLNWLRHYLLEFTHSNKTRESHTVAVGNHWDRLLTQSQKRYLRSCESLAKVRKLLAEAEIRQQQAREKQTKSAAVANRLLKDLTG